MSATAKTVAAFLAALLLASPATAGDLKFATEPLPPFVQDDQGAATGPLVEVVEAVCQAAGLACSVTLMPWRRTLFAADSGEVDGLFPMLPTPERQRKYQLTPPVVRTSYSFLVPEDSTWTFTNPGSLEGRTVAVYGPSGSSSVIEDIAATIPGTRIELEVSNEGMLRKLAGGRYGATGTGFANRDTAQSIMRQDGIAGIRLAGDAREVVYAIALSRKTVPEATARQFTAALAALKASGAIRAILARHHLQSAP